MLKRETAARALDGAAACGNLLSPREKSPMTMTSHETGL
jgi:hypothetical protein